MPSARWHDSHFAWKIGATSFVNVGVLVGSAAWAIPATSSTAPTVKAHRPSQLVGLPYIRRAPFETSRSGRLIRRPNCAGLGAYTQVTDCNRRDGWGMGGSSTRPRFVIRCYPSHCEGGDHL